MDKKESKRSNNKAVKLNGLFNAAYDLFTTKGIHETAIDDIVKKAGVAKGTFYLYFKDKYDVMNRIVLKKSYEVLKSAIEDTNVYTYDNFVDGVIAVIEYLIEYFKRDKLLLKIIYKNLSWGLYMKTLATPEDDTEMKNLFLLLEKRMVESGFKREDVKETFFMVIELTGAVLYSSIILEEPNNIDNMKPVLFNMVRKMLS